MKCCYTSPRRKTILILGNRYFWDAQGGQRQACYCSCQIIFSERESCDVTTTKNHLPASNWQDLSLLARKCILDIPGCIWACSVHVVVRSSRDDHRAARKYKPRPRFKVLDIREYASCKRRRSANRPDF